MSNIQPSQAVSLHSKANQKRPCILIRSLQGPVTTLQIGVTGNKAEDNIDCN